MLSHINLQIYYQMLFSMVQHHKYSIKEIEDLIPFERDIYFSLLVNYIQKQKQQE